MPDTDGSVKIQITGDAEGFEDTLAQLESRGKQAAKGGLSAVDQAMDAAGKTAKSAESQVKTLWNTFQNTKSVQQAQKALQGLGKVLKAPFNLMKSGKETVQKLWTAFQNSKPVQAASAVLKTVAKPIQAVAGAAQKTAQRVQKLWTAFQNNKVVQAAGKAFSVAAKAILAVGSACSAAAVKVVQWGSEFETASAKLETIVNASDGVTKSMAELEVELLTLSGATGQSAAELAEVAYNAISAGTAVDDAVGMAETATKLATAGFTTADSALSVLTTTMNAYGESAGTAQEISDSLILVQNRGVTTIDQLAGSMGKAIATASAYNVDLQNLESSYISLTKAGISTEESTTYLSSMLNELGDSGSEVGEILQKKTGKTFGQLMTEGNSLADVLGILNESVEGDSEALMNLWGSAEAGKASAAIVGQGLETFNGNLQDLKNAAGETEAAYATMTDTFSHKASVLKQNVQNLGISIYQGMEEPLKAAADRASGLVENLSSAFQSGGISGLAGALGGVASEAVTALSGMLPQVVQIGVSVLSSLISGIQSNAPALAGAAVSAFSALVSGIFTLAPQLLDAAVVLVVSLVQGLASQAPSLVTQGAALLLNLLSGIAQALPQLAAAGGDLLLGLVQGLVAAIPLLAEQGPQIIYQLIVGLFSAIGTLVSSAGDIVSVLWDTITTTDWAALGRDLITAILQGLWDGAVALAGSVWSGIKSLFGLGSEEAGESCGEEFAAGLSGTSDSVQQAGSTLSATAISGLSGTSRTLGSCGSQAGQSYANGLAQTGGSAHAASLGLAQSSAFALSGTDFSLYGTSAGEGYALGLSGAVSAAGEAGAQVAGAAADSVDSYDLSAEGQQTAQSFSSGIIGQVGTINTAGQQIALSVSNGIAAKFSVLKLRGTGMGNQVKAGLKSVSLQAVGASAIAGFITGMESKRAAVKSKAVSLANTAKNAMKDALDIQSPSRVMAREVGAQMAAGVALGMVQSTPNAVFAMEESARRMVSSAQRAAASAVSPSFGAGSFGAPAGRYDDTTLRRMLTEIQKTLEEGQVLKVNERVLGQTLSAYQKKLLTVKGG